jgi:hypothetical protein
MQAPSPVLDYVRDYFYFIFYCNLALIRLRYLYSRSPGIYCQPPVLVFKKNKIKN